MIKHYNPSVRDVLKIRLSYKPHKVRVLFIGESPPASGEFFYFGGNNSLLKYIRQAFISVYGDKCGDGDEFLQFFKENGYYLDDLSEEPINRILEKERRQLRKANIGSLAKRLKEIHPESVIIFMKSIEKDVRKALKNVGIPQENIRATKFPGSGNQKVSVQEITEALRELK